MSIYKQLQHHGENNYTQYSSEVILSKEELLNKLKSVHDNIEINFADEKWFEILEYTEGR